MNTASLSCNDCFALLDDSAGDALEKNKPRSRLYTDLAHELRGDAAALARLLEEMQNGLMQGLHAVGIFSYELGAALHGIEPHGSNVPPVRILLFRRCEKMHASQVEEWLARHDATQEEADGAGIADLRAGISREQFEEALARIHAYIETGDTYQVNFTYRLHFDAYGSVHALYRRLRSRQPVPFGALISLPDGGALLSLSPELFVRHEQGILTAQPMKGTAAADSDDDGDEDGKELHHAEENRLRAAALASDEKNRAENVMIVDLLRNDLGRIAQTGSVKVPQMFAVEKFGKVLQMTSTIQAQLRADATLGDIFAALYPCGSITGAPKCRTMQIIRELESEPRGVYTGAIGWFDAAAGMQAVGDFCLSVPIRTLALGPLQESGVRRGEMGVGAGIVHDSRAQDEYAECALKAGFLTGLEQDFELFETLHATREKGCRHCDLHLRRLAASAAYFGFAYDEARIQSALEQACAALPGQQPHRLRLSLNQQGQVAIRVALLEALAEPVKLLLAPEPIHAHPLFLRHKTTMRQQYDQAWQAAQAQGAFDMLFFNEAGELTEGGRSNVLLKLDGRWYTPPLACGLLPGVMREVLLNDSIWQVRERVLRREDVQRAEEIAVCNALRGVLRADLA